MNASFALKMIHRLSFSVVMFALLAVPALAQVSSSERQVLTNSLRDAAENLDLDRLGEIDDAKQTVASKAGELIELVNRASAGERREGWFDYLKLDPLVTAIEDDASFSKVYRESIALKQRLYGVAPGLEYAEFRQLRSALDRLIPALKYSKRERATEILSKKIVAEADDLDAMESVPTIQQFVAASELLALLSEVNQSAPAVDLLRQNFGHPNISVWIGEGVVQRVVQRPVNETKPVVDCILGTSINGQATLTGTISADLIPVQGAVGLNVSLAGNVISRNRGYNKPVSLTTTSYGKVTASRALYVSESGVSLEPTFVRAQLRSEVNSIYHRFRFVRRIARRKAAESKPQAEAIGVEKLKQKVGTQFADQVADASNIQPPDVMQKVRPVLQRLDIPEPARAIGSTEDSIYLHTHVQRENQLAAPNPAPPIYRSYDAAIQIHESAINNTIGYLMAGRTVNQDQVNELMGQMGLAPATPAVASGSVSSDAGDDDKTAEEEPPFEVDFDKTRPVIFEARDGKLRVGIRGTRFEQGTRGIKDKLEIAAVYVPGIMADGSVILLREGDVEIEFPSTKRNTTRQSATKGAIEKNFATVFPETILHQPIVLPQTIKAEALRGQVYRPRLIEARDGWLTVALQ